MSRLTFGPMALSARIAAMSMQHGLGALREVQRPGLRKCYACRKTFTVRIGSIFEDSHFPMHLWLQAIHLICQSKKGVSTRQIQRAFNCSMKTAWFLMHRIRECMGETDTSPLGGAEKMVESDETFVGGKARNRAYREPAPKQAVVSLVERGGKVRSRHVPTVTADRIRRFWKLESIKPRICGLTRAMFT